MTRFAFAALALAVVCAGCPKEQPATDISIYAITGAPPARTATVVTSDTEATITISRGVDAITVTATPMS